MLKTLKEQLMKKNADISFESLVLDANERRDTRELMLADMGAVEVDDNFFSDDDIERIISKIPETDIDIDTDNIMAGLISARNAAGVPVDISIDECCESFIPDTEEVA